LAVCDDGSGVVWCRYIGLTKTHTQHLLEAIAYNLYRAPGIIIKIGKINPAKALKWLKKTKKRICKSEKTRLNQKN